ncbi:MAG: hypothetical protein ACFFG0_17695 [Candidatus Thorarchaeota archaeon]
MESSHFSINIEEVNGSITHYEIITNSSKISLDDFKDDINELILKIKSKDTTHEDFKTIWVKFVDDTAQRLKNFIYEHLGDVVEDPNFKKFIWYYFQFSELIFHSVGKLFIEKREWNLAYWFYQQVLRGYELIHRCINYKLIALDNEKINFDEVKWGVPTANIAISLLNSGQFEEGLFYMLAADYNDKCFEPNFKGLAERVIKEQIFQIWIKSFQKNGDILRNLYKNNNIDLANSLIKDNNTLEDFLKQEENLRYFLYIIVNFEKILKWDTNFIKSDYDYTLHYIFKLMITITHIIEVWFKKLTNISGSKMTGIRNLVKKFFPSDFKKSLFRPKLSNFKNGIEFSDYLENFYNQCFDNKINLTNNLDVIHYSIFFIISIRNFSNHNFYTDVPFLKEDISLYRLIDGFIIGILAWLDAIFKYLSIP